MDNRNRNSLCIFCYKKPSFPSPSFDSTANSQFISFLSRYLNLSPQSQLISNPNSSSSYSIVCDDCSHFGSSFCDLYFQLEVIRMKLNLKVNKICDIMVCAKRIPSRHMLFKEQFEEATSTQKSPKLGGLDELKRIQDFRKIVIKRGKRKLQSANPQVLLRRLDEQERISQPPTKPSPPPVITKETQEQKIVTQQQLLALLAVMNLTALNVDGLHSQTPPPSTSTAATQTEDNLNPVIESELQEDSFQLHREFGDGLESENLDRDPLELEPEEEAQNYDDADDQENCVEFAEAVFDKETSTLNSNIEVYLDVDEDDDNDYRFGMPFSLFLNENMNEDDNVVDMEVEEVPHPPSSSGEEESADAEIESEEEEEKEEEEETSVDCEKCGKKLECLAALEKHRVLVHHLKNYVRCPICHQMFHNFSYYKKHRTLGNAANKCHVWGTEISELVPASAPEYPYDGLGIGGGTFFCRRSKCYEVFSSKQKLKVHLKTHGVWKCSRCSKSYSKAHHLAWHEVEVHKNKELEESKELSQDHLHRCNRCKATFGLGHKLTQHFIEKHLNLDVSVVKPNSRSKAKFQSTSTQSTGTGAEKKIERNVRAVAVALGKNEILGECPICKITLPFCATRKMLQEHVQKYHYVGDMDPAVIYKCQTCKAPFRSSVFLQEHLVDVHKINRRK
ncbi:unnamed protein product [Orchesella dallaii]|uniref:C2H2-type domain-containing protein n=1 Tax=Orchesella dallaii TaxID=48710 RepID=A0ABP1S137_9HEXA